MNDISYRVMGAAGALGWISVYIGRRKAGEIRPVPGGYQYITLNGSRGNVYPSVGQVKQSLESR